MTTETCCCRFCDRTARDSCAASEEGWIPSFWVGDRERFEPVCPECLATYLELSADYGDYSVTPFGRLRLTTTGEGSRN
jgi:hypothetical protein